MIRTDYIIYNGQLYHHGVKGMKWGRRKKHEKTSKPTKSKHRIMLEEKYQKQGLSKQEAEIKASKRIRTEKILAVAGGITIAAATAYVVNKKLKTRADGMIKAGGTLQRIKATDSDTLHDVFYAANNKSDKAKYAGRFGYYKMKSAGHAYKMDIGVDKDIKIAGNKKAINTFKKLYETDPDFKQQVGQLTSKNIRGGNTANGNFRKMYENFNTNIYDPDLRNNSAYNKFYSALKSEGYGAVRDVHDMKFSGYKAKNPLIIFDSKGSVSVNKVSEMTGDEVLKNLKSEYRRQSVESVSKFVAASTPVAALSTYAYDYKPVKTNKKQAR